MNNKKGISAIVATVLIILITVAAVTIIWAAIIPMINDNISTQYEMEDGVLCNFRSLKYGNTHFSQCDNEFSYINPETYREVKNDKD